MTLILMLALADTQATLSGEIIEEQTLTKYIGLRQEQGRNQKRHSNF